MKSTTGIRGILIAKKNAINNNTRNDFYVLGTRGEATLKIEDIKQVETADKIKLSNLINHRLEAQLIQSNKSEKNYDMLFTLTDYVKNNLIDVQLITADSEYSTYYSNFRNEIITYSNNNCLTLEYQFELSSDNLRTVQITAEKALSKTATQAIALAAISATSSPLFEYHDNTFGNVGIKPNWVSLPVLISVFRNNIQLDTESVLDYKISFKTDSTKSALNNASITNYITFDFELKLDKTSLKNNNSINDMYSAFFNDKSAVTYSLVFQNNNSSERINIEMLAKSSNCDFTIADEERYYTIKSTKRLPLNDLYWKLYSAKTSNVLTIQV